MITLTKLNKKISTVFLIIFLLFTGFGPVSMSDFLLIISEIQKENNIIDKIYLAQQNPNVVDNFKFGIREVKAALDSNELEYMVDIGPVTGSTSANYVYASFFNPSGSGRTAVIKRIAVRSNAVAASGYVNLSVRRITAASSGTQLAAGDIPKKNTDSSNSITEVRHTGVTVTFAGSADSRILGQATPGAAGHYYSIRDITFDSGDEKLILQPGEGIALYQEAAGTVNLRNRIYVEWEEVTSTPTAQSEFIFTFPWVKVAATANYVFNSFFNPAASGKTAIIKRIGFGTNTADGTNSYYQNISLRRITSASAGTAITASYVPKKNTGSANSVMDFRRTGVTVTLVGTVDARLGMITPGTTGYATGWQEIDFLSTDEYIILQPGEGIALISEGTGDSNQLPRMMIEWQEVSSGSTPASQGEYILAFPRVSDEALAPALDTTFYTFFNPAASGKTAVIKRLVIRNNADTTATYSNFNFRRLTAASGGVQITNTDVPKKHTGTSNSVTELRYCGTTCASAITATYSGTADSRLMTVSGPGAATQTRGQREIVFGDNEKLILQPGEGIGFYLDLVAGDVDHYVKILIEWDEEVSTPTAQGEYLIDVVLSGSTTSGYTYASFFNPAASGKTAIIKKLTLRIDAAASALYIPMTIRRTTAASAGTQITAANIPKKHTGSADPIVVVRRTGVTTTYAGTADSRMIGFQTPGTVGSATASATSGYKDYVFKNDEQIILQQGEGIALYQEAAGDADFRVKIAVEWDEETVAPSSQGEYLMTVGPITGSLDSGYVYASFFNPSNSAKNYVVKRIAIMSNRYSTLVAPGYIPITLRKTTVASGGTQIAVANIPKKHTGTANTTAEIRHTGASVTFAGETNSRLLGVTATGVVNQLGDYDSEIIYQDELILKPGEGIALYQEATAGDTLIRYRFAFEWKEETAAVISISVSDGVVTYGTIPTNTSKNTTSGDINDTQVATNDGTLTENFNIKGQNSANWTIAAASGSNQYVHGFCTSGSGTPDPCDTGPTWTALTTNYQTLATGISTSGTQRFDLRITTPNPSTVFTEQSVDITVQAVQQ